MFSLVQQRTIWWPTWQGWLILLLGFLGCIAVAIIGIHPFLAVTHRVQARILVLEGWMPDEVVRAAAHEFAGGNYAHLIVCEGSSDAVGSPVRSNDASSGAAAHLASLGVPQEAIVVCWFARTNQHRSMAMAVVVREELVRRSMGREPVNVMAPGPHARKTWLVYRRALAPAGAVGIISVPTADHKPDRWWESTAGAKWVLLNAIGWLYQWVAGRRK